MGLIIGKQDGGTASIDDLVISGPIDFDTTLRGMDTSSVDYTDVEFIYKSDKASDTLKNNLKLKNVY